VIVAVHAINVLPVAAATVNLLVATATSEVTANVPATTVLPLAPATVNLSVFTFISDVADNTRSSPAQRVISSLDNIPAVAVSNHVTVPVHAITVLPVAHATVNLSVLIAILDVADPVNESPAPNTTPPLAVIAPVKTEVPVTAKLAQSVEFPEVANVVTLAAPVGVGTPLLSIRVVIEPSAATHPIVAQPLRYTSSSNTCDIFNKVNN
jgi:hypothetical protein